MTHVGDPEHLVSRQIRRRCPQIRHARRALSDVGKSRPATPRTPLDRRAHGRQPGRSRPPATASSTPTPISTSICSATRWMVPSQQAPARAPANFSSATPIAPLRIRPGQRRRRDWDSSPAVSGPIEALGNGLHWPQPHLRSRSSGKISSRNARPGRCLIRCCKNCITTTRQGDGPTRPESSGGAGGPPFSRAPFANKKLGVYHAG